MNGYGRIYGGNASRLLARFGAAAWSILAENGQIMQQIANTVCEYLPMRKVTEPYLDLLNLTEPEKAVFFGGRMIFETDSAVFDALCRRLSQEPFFADGRYSAAFAEDEPLAMQRLMQIPHSAAKQEQAWAPFARKADADRPVQLLTYPICGHGATGNSMERRAFAREGLAFGEIACRLIREVGGETACSADGCLVFRADEAALPELMPKLTELCRKKCRPYCLENAHFPKISVFE